MKNSCTSDEFDDQNIFLQIQLICVLYGVWLTCGIIVESSGGLAGLERNLATFMQQREKGIKLINLSEPLTAV
jgi:hypothetical protein